MGSEKDNRRAAVRAAYYLRPAPDSARLGCLLPLIGTSQVVTGGSLRARGPAGSCAYSDRLLILR
jgi:hypothetical protein